MERRTRPAVFTKMTDKEIYQRIVGGTDKNLERPIASFLPKPTQADYLHGTIIRYFARQANQPTGEITELNKTNYDRVKTQGFYLTVAVSWKISGTDKNLFDERGIRTVTGISTANSMELDLAEKTMPGLRSKLTNVYQFWKGTISK